MSTLEQWSSVEEAKWGPLPSLGPEWMGKSFTCERGYQVLLTNGCGIWGESRGARYIIEKAEVGKYEIVGYFGLAYARSCLMNHYTEFQI